MSWLDGNILYWHWIIFGLILITLELFIPVFVVLWLGIAAVIVGLFTLFIPLGFNLQIILWGVLSAAFVFLWHKYISPKMLNKTLAGLSREAMIGQIGIIIRFSSSQGRGRLRFSAPIVGNDEWDIISTEVLTEGDKVKVTDISGNSLIVAKL